MGDKFPYYRLSILFLNWTGKQKFAEFALGSKYVLPSLLSLLEDPQYLDNTFRRVDGK
jgi:hypothetical protein